MTILSSTAFHAFPPGMEEFQIDLLVHISAPSGAKDDAIYRKQVAGFFAFEPVGEKVSLLNPTKQPSSLPKAHSEHEKSLSRNLQNRFSRSTPSSPEREYREDVGTSEFSSWYLKSQPKSKDSDLQRSDNHKLERSASDCYISTSPPCSSSILLNKTPVAGLSVVQVQQTVERPRVLGRTPWSIASSRVFETPLRAIPKSQFSSINYASKQKLKKRAASTSPISTVKWQRIDSDTFKPMPFTDSKISNQSSDIPTFFMTSSQASERSVGSPNSMEISSRIPRSSSDFASTNPNFTRDRASPLVSPLMDKRKLRGVSATLSASVPMQDGLSDYEKSFNLPRLKSDGEELEVHPPPPTTGTGRMGPQSEAGFLPAVRAKLPLEKHYRPKLVSRKLREHERGHWRIDTGTWDVKRTSRFWKMLREEVIRGLCGWGVWATRRDDETVGHSKSRQSSVVKVYCWGEIVGDMWLVLYMTSEGKVRGTNATWIDGSGRAVVEMD